MTTKFPPYRDNPINRSLVTFRPNVARRATFRKRAARRAARIVPMTRDFAYWLSRSLDVPTVVYVQSAERAAESLSRLWHDISLDRMVGSTLDHDARTNGVTYHAVALLLENAVGAIRDGNYRHAHTLIRRASWVRAMGIA